MAISHELQVSSHDSIYLNKQVDELGFNRKLNVYFSIPQNGTNEDTGLLLFIAGFGGQANSNVYKQMRNEFADKYNLITIQCDYFGYEFMQAPDKIIKPTIERAQLDGVILPHDIKNIYERGQFDYDTFLKLGSKYPISASVDADLSGETKNNFNDMGLLQAIDNIVAVLNVISILYNNDCCFNIKKNIIYGHSHGAYLSYLCNAFAPKLFSLIIDNSAWLYPIYLHKNRLFFRQNGEMTLTTIFDYLAKRVLADQEILDLPFLYSQFENNCKIISYHGSTDNLTCCQDKLAFCNAVKKCVCNEISQDKIDNIIFKSTNHGLDADFKKLFAATMENSDMIFDKSTSLDLDNEIIYQTSKYNYLIDYQNIVPKLSIS